MTMRRLWSAWLVTLTIAAPALAQPLADSKTITAANPSCLVSNCVEVAVRGVPSIGIDVSGSGTFTLVVEGSRNNGKTWRAVTVIDDSDQGSLTSSIEADGGFSLPNSGFTHVRVRASSLSAGTPVVTVTRGVLAPLDALGGGGGGGGGAGTEYTEGQTDASITGTAAMMEVAGDTLRPIQGSVADGLLVNLGANNDVVVSGAVSVSSMPTDLDVQSGGADLATAAQMATLIGHADGLEGLLSTIDGRVDGVEGLLTTSNNNTSAAAGSLASIDGKLPPLDGGRVPVAVSGSIEVGDLEVGAQPPDDPHFVTCAAGGVAGACDVALAADDPGVAAIVAAIGGIEIPAPTGGSTLTEQQAQTALLTTLDADTSALVNQTADYDTGGGTDTTVMLGIALPASGGAVAAPGDTTNGIDVDVTRVQGTVQVQSNSANLGTAANQTTIIGHVDGIEGLLGTSNTNTGNAATALGLLDNPVGHLTGGTAGTSSFAVGGIYTSSPPTLTNNQQSAFRMSSAGRLLADVDCSNCSFPEEVIDGDADAIKALFVDGDGAPLTLAQDATEGEAAPTSGPLGMFRRDDALSTLTPTEGQATPGLTNARGALWTALDTTGLTLPISGTVTANLSATDNQVLDDILEAIGELETGTVPTDTDDNSIAGGQVVGVNAALIYAWDGSAWARARDIPQSVHGDEALAEGLAIHGYASAAAPTPVDGTDAVRAWMSPFGALNVILRDLDGDYVSGGGGGGGTEYDDGDAEAEPRGALALGYDGSNLRALATDANGYLQIEFAAAQPVTQSGTWTVTGAGGSFPVTDSGGSLTIDAPVGTPAFVRLSDGTDPISTLPVSLASVPSHAVTNAGTFAVQVSSAIPAGTNNIGDVDVLSLPALPAGNNNIGDIDVLTLPIAFNTGAASGMTARTVTASDSPEIAHLSNLATYLQPSTGAIIRSDNTDNDDETQIKGSAGVLLAISGRNAHASTDAYVRCANATAASTTPGSTAVIYELMLPFGGGWVQGSLGPAGRAFNTALTCWVATGKAATDTTDAALDDVVVNVDFR